MGSRGNAGEKGLRGGSVHNEFEKVTEKGCFGRHLPDGQGQRAGTSRSRDTNGAAGEAELEENGPGGD